MGTGSDTEHAYRNTEHEPIRNRFLARIMGKLLRRKEKEMRLTVGKITGTDQTNATIEVKTEPYGVTVEIGGWEYNEAVISLTKKEAKELRKLLKEAINAK